MKRNSIIYKIAKKCENPPLNNSFWLFLNYLYNVIVVLYGELNYSFLLNKEKEFILNPAFSNGDLILIYRGLSMLKRMNNVQNPSLLVSSDLRNPAESLGLKEICFISPLGIFSLSKMVLLNPLKHRNIIFSIPWHLLNTEDLLNKIGTEGPDCSISNDSIKKIFGKKKSGNMVILSPYQQTFSVLGYKCLSSFFWIRLAEKLKHEGLHVFTNCDGKKELPIPGTECFFPKWKELAGSLEYAGGCISVRSGFTDWAVLATGIKQVVLYPSKDFFEKSSIKKVGCKNCLEIVYKDIPEELLLEEILNYYLS